jgi:hypothetical protein
MKRRLGPLSGGLEQLDGVAIGILQQDLLAAGTNLHLVAKVEPVFLQFLDSRRQIGT